MVSHLVLTRFNLAIHFECKKRYGTQCPDFPWISEEYLERRFKIFEQYTYPSFRNQTDQNFKWVVLFHINTPHRFKQQIEKYKKEMKNFEAWYFDDDESENFEKIIYQYIKQNLPGGLITTRVDNDDLVHKRFIESIKKDFAYQNAMELLTYPNGLQYDSTCNTLLSYKRENNHFLSLYVANTDYEVNHILQFNHHKINSTILEYDFKKIAVNVSPPLWVEVITESNYSNVSRWRFQRVLLPKSYSQEYNIPELWNGFGSYVRSMIMGIVKVTPNFVREAILRIKTYRTK